MEKVDQYANRDINNVQGNQYIINNPTFKLAGEDRTGKFILEKISSVNYWEELKCVLDSKKLISRKSILDDLKKILNKSTSLLLYGEPGIGKTTLVREILLGIKIVYISLRDRCIDEVFIYLIESYGLPFNKEDMFFTLEGLLRSSNYLFVFDDCESNKEIAQKLERLGKFKNKFLYLSRNKSVFLGVSIIRYELKELTKDEVKEFVELYMKGLEKDLIDELFIKSKGNPLYLYYYVNYKINPLPIGLESYQEALWENLNSKQKEILSCVSITNSPIKRDVLKESVDKITSTNSTLMEFQHEISIIEYLLENHNGVYHIFHPLFKEYILKYVNNYCIKNEYETIVGESAIKKNDIIEGTLLLLDKENEIINQYLLEVGIYLYRFSKILLSLRVLEKALKVYKKDETYKEYYAHTNYHISQIYRDINNKELGDLCINEAIEVYKELNDDQGYFLCIVFKATFLADDGKKVETEKLLKEINEFDSDDEELKGYLYVNMSKINLSFNQYENAAKNAKIAYESFMKVNNKNGAIKSLLNYSGALANIDQEHLATEYLEKILDNDKIKINKAIKSAVMNNLTLCYRKNKQYEKAIEVCNKSIKISEELGQPSKVAMNILNLGNVYRDLKEWNKCESLYLKGVKIAENQGVVREIGRGNELLASSSYMQGKFLDCINYSEKAIVSSKLVNDDFRVAEAYIEMSRGYLALNQVIPYINCIEEAVKYYIKENFIDEAVEYLLKLIKYYSKNYNEIKIKEHLNKITELINYNVDIDYSSLYYNLDEISEDVNSNEIINMYHHIIISYLNTKMKANLLQMLIDFTSICKINNNNHTKRLFIDIINHLIVKGKKIKRAMNILAFTIEQSGELLDITDIGDIIQKLQESSNDIYVRTAGGGVYIFTDYWNSGVYVQYTCEPNQLINIKVLLAVYLIMKFNNECIMENVDDIKCKFIDFSIFDFNSLKDALGESDFIIESDFAEIPVKFTSGVTSDVTTFIILGNEYEIKANHGMNKHNKVFIYVIMNIFLQLVQRINDISIEKADMLYAKKGREFVEYLTWVKSENVDSKWIIEPLTNNSKENL